LNYENHSTVGLAGAIRRQAKRALTSCIQPLDDLLGRVHDNKTGWSQGIGNVKPGTADTLETHFLNDYDPTSQEHEVMAFLHKFGSDKLASDTINVTYVAANVRYATDFIYGNSYSGAISQEGARRILGAHNFPNAVYGVETEPGNEGIDLLIRAAHGEIFLPFFPGR
jgi:hypothetical protein